MRLRLSAGRRRLDLAPPTVLALLYAGLIALGTVLLRMPAAATAPVSWGDALFTATSAVTVTGLTVVETGGLTLVGQAVVLALIQLGGLGLMTFTVLVASMLGLPVGVPQRAYLREELQQTSLAEVVRLARIILRIVLLVEGAGVALLALVFVPDLGWAAGLWHALFLAVSAFNNAGFTLFAEGLRPWVDDPLVNLVVPALFIIGGIGFSVLADLARRRRWRGLTLHTKLTLVGTAGLVVAAVAGVAALEWSNPRTLGALDGAGAKWLAAWFHAVTPRTAGFATLDVAQLHDSTALVTIVLMLVGGGTTSTAGGLKVTTLLVLLLATVAFLRGRRAVTAFHRSLGTEEVMKVLALTTLAFGVVTLAIFLVSISHDGDLFDLAFEIVSAFGTVGLSRGATAELDALGRGVVIAVMFVGRIGPLTLGFVLATRTASRIRYPRGQVMVG
jgi:trk system potassium uptake protein TrkH